MSATVTSFVNLALLKQPTHAWRCELLTIRIRELTDARMSAFTIDGLYYGNEVVAELVGNAIWCCDHDELEYCEGLCEAAEAAIIRERRRQ